jgi:hypothetical protein
MARIACGWKGWLAMNSILRLVGVALAATLGVLVYDLAMPDALVKDVFLLLVVLAAQLLVGWASGMLVRSWWSLVVVPGSFVIGFMLLAPQAAVSGILKSAMETPAASTQFATIAGGVYWLAVVFVLALLCSLATLGAAVGTRRGIGIEKRTRARWQRRRILRRMSEAADRDTPNDPTIDMHEPAHATRTAERELVVASR